MSTFILVFQKVSKEIQTETLLQSEMRTTSPQILSITIQNTSFKRHLIMIENLTMMMIQLATARKKRESCVLIKLGGGNNQPTLLNLIFKYIQIHIVKASESVDFTGITFALLLLILLGIPVGMDY